MHRPRCFSLLCFRFPRLFFSSSLAASFFFIETVFHRDYTIRLLQQFVISLAKLAGLVKKKDVANVEMELESTVQSFLGLPRSLFVKMSASSMMQMFSVTGELDADRTAVAALLLKEEAELARMVGSSEEAALLAERSQELIEAALAGRISTELRDLLRGP